MFDYLSAILSDLISSLQGKNWSDYWLGVLFAILAGVFANLGTICQKIVVNKLPSDAKLMRSLIKNPLWLFGTILQWCVSAIFFMLTQLFIGPTLYPGLAASGLIVLAIGSVKIVGEKLNLSEYIGIFLMITAIAFIGFSNMEIKVDLVNFLEAGLIIRLIIFTVSVVFLSVIFEISERKNIQKGISLAILTGLMLAISNLWISPLIGVIAHVFGGKAVLAEFLIFAASGIILLVVNVIAISKTQEAFTVGQASNLIPLQNVSTQSAPPFYFLFVYLLPIPNVQSMIFLITGIGLVILSSFLLGKRQAEIEKIK